MNNSNFTQWPVLALKYALDHFVKSKGIKESIAHQAFLNAKSQLEQYPSSQHRALQVGKLSAVVLDPDYRHYKIKQADLITQFRRENPQVIALSHGYQRTTTGCWGTPGGLRIASVPVFTVSEGCSF